MKGVGELLKLFFSVLDGDDLSRATLLEPRDLGRCSCVCKSWKNVMEGAESAWRLVYNQEFNSGHLGTVRGNKEDRETSWRGRFSMDYRWKRCRASMHSFQVLDARTKLRLGFHGKRVVMVDGSNVGELDLATGKCGVLNDGSISRGRISWVESKGDWVMAGREDGWVKIWNRKSHAKRRVKVPHLKDAVCVDFGGCPPRFIASAQSDKSISVWDMVRGTCMKLEGHLTRITHLQIVGDRLVSGSGYTLKVWDIHTGACIQTFYTRAPITSIDSNGKIVISGARFSGIQVWDVASGDCITELETTESYYVRLKGRWLASGMADRLNNVPLVRLWDMETGECMKVFKGPKLTCLESLQFDGDRIAAAFSSKEVRVWEVKDCHPVREKVPVRMHRWRI